MISVNPYRSLPIYDAETMKSYKGCEMFERPAHLFALAEAAYRTLRYYCLNSCIVISGEFFLFVLNFRTNLFDQVNRVREKRKRQKLFFDTSPV